MKTQRVYSPILVRKITQVLLDKSEIGRTELSQATNVNYTRLMEQLSWLEQKQYVELAISGRRVVIRLTEKGRDYSTKLLELEG